MHRLMQLLVLIFTLFPSITMAEVDLDATNQFSRDVETYFQKAFGEDAVKQTRPIEAIPQGLGTLWTGSTNSSGTILKPLALVLLKNNLVCRVGLGFVWNEGKPTMKPRTTVFSECLPLSQDLNLQSLSLTDKFSALVSRVLMANAAFDDIVENAKNHLSATFTDSHIPLAQFSYIVTDRFVRAERLWSYLDPRDMNREFTSLKFGAYAEVLYEFGPKGQTRINVPLWEAEVKSCNSDLILDQSLKADSKFVRYFN